MISNILLIGSAILVFCGYFSLLVFYFINTKKNTKNTGLDISIKILDDDNNINLVESRENYFSCYDIKRNIIKLSFFTYNSSSLFSNFIASLLSYYALYKSKYLDLLCKFGFRRVRFISFSSIIGIIVSIFCRNSFDAKIGLLVLIVISIYQYILSIVYENSTDCKINKNMVSLFKMFNNINKLLFISSLIQIIRFVIIIIDL